MVPRARTWLLVLATLITGAVTGGQLGCSCAAERAACTRDGDCGEGEVCLADGYCVPRAAAERFLQTDAAQVGRRNTLDIEATFLTPRHAP